MLPPPVTPECGTSEDREVEAESFVTAVLVIVLDSGSGRSVSDVVIVEGGTMLVFVVRVIATK